MRASTFVNALVLSATLLVAAPLAAQITGFEVRRIDNSAGGEALNGFVTHDLTVDFTGPYTGSFLIVELERGSIYQNTKEVVPGFPVAGDTPPDPVVFDLFPAARFDTFIAHGGPTSNDTFGGDLGLTLGAGACPPCRNQFDEFGIHQTYNASPSIDPPRDMQDFLVARITFSSDAVGTLSYLGSANGVISDRFEHRIVNGLIGVPEPASCLTAVVGVIASWALLPRRCAPLARRG